MLEKLLFITKMFLDGMDKLFSQDVLVPFFIHGCVLGQNYESAQSIQLRNSHTHEWGVDALLLGALLVRSPIIYTVQS